MTTFYTLIIMFSGVLVEPEIRFSSQWKCQVTATNTINWMMFGPSFDLPWFRIKFPPIESATYACMPMNYGWE